MSNDHKHDPPLPANVDAEKAILGAILLSEMVSENSSLKEARIKLTAEDFSLSSHRLIFDRMCELKDAGTAVDIVTLVEAMAHKKYEVGEVQINRAGDKDDGIKTELWACGGAEYIASLTEGMPRYPSIKDYIAIVKEKHDLRRILSACTEAIAKCYEQTGTAAEVLEEMGNGLKGIRRKKA